MSKFSSRQQSAVSVKPGCTISFPPFCASSANNCDRNCTMRWCRSSGLLFQNTLLPAASVSGREKSNDDDSVKKGYCEDSR